MENQSNRQTEVGSPASLKDVIIEWRCETYISLGDIRMWLVDNIGWNAEATRRSAEIDSRISEIERLIAEVDNLLSEIDSRPAELEFFKVEFNSRRQNTLRLRAEIGKVRAEIVLGLSVDCNSAIQ